MIGRRWLGLVLAAQVTMMLVAGCAGKRTASAPSEEAPTARVDTVASPPAVCPIDGQPTTEDAINRRPLAVMIENHPRARPQSGLLTACVVYEAITEGGITRFMPIFLHGAPKVIGPVRSARPHFIYSATAYNAGYVHCGQSYEALQILEPSPPLPNMDEMKYPDTFWRDRTREKPHNLYTSTERLRDLLQRERWDGHVPDLPAYANGGALPNGKPANEVRITFGGVTHYDLRLVYDAAKEGYLRYMDGKLHADRETGKPIVVKNVVIQYVEAAEFPGSTYHTYDVRVLGSGTGLLASSGQQVALRWNKPSTIANTAYTSETGAPLPFQSGQTWIELVPRVGSRVTVK